MSIDEAIKHCLEVSNDENLCDECREQHKQLAEWLIELKQLKGE